MAPRALALFGAVASLLVSTTSAQGYYATSIGGYVTYVDSLNSQSSRSMENLHCVLCVCE